MKKLFAKPMFHYTFVLTCVALVMGLMIGVVNAITAPIIEENLRKARVAAYQLVLPEMDTFDDVARIDSDPLSIEAKVVAKNSNGDVVGYIYEAYTTNKYGFMRIVVSVDANGKILGATFIEIRQTLLQDRTENSIISAVGSNIASFDLIKVAGATGSFTTLQSLLSDIRLAHSKMDIEPSDPMIIWYGEGFQLETDPAFVANSIVLSKQIVRDVDGYIVGAYYHLRGTGISYGDETGTINLYVALDKDGVILGILVPRDEYGHTTSNAFYGKILTLSQAYVGVDMDEFVRIDDLISGATNSENLFNSLLEALGGNR